MNLKSKNKIYKKIIEEVCKKYESAQEFIANKVKELCSQGRIFTEEVCRQFRANLFLLSFRIKMVFFFMKRKTYKELKQHVFFEVCQEQQRFLLPRKE